MSEGIGSISDQDPTGAQREALEGLLADPENRRHILATVAALRHGMGELIKTRGPAGNRVLTDHKIVALAPDGRLLLATGARCPFPDDARYGALVATPGAQDSESDLDGGMSENVVAGLGSNRWLKASQLNATRQIPLDSGAIVEWTPPSYTDSSWTDGVLSGDYSENEPPSMTVNPNENMQLYVAAPDGSVTTFMPIHLSRAQS